jgi:hypothetical protein
MDKEGMVHYLKGVIHPNNVFPKNKVTWVKVPEFEPLTLNGSCTEASWRRMFSKHLCMCWGVGKDWFPH